MAIKTIKNETPEMKAMFEYYYSLGDSRSFQKVSDKYEMSMTTIKRYAKSFGWTVRVTERDQAVNNRIEDLAVESVINSIADIRIQLKHITDKAWEDVARGKIKIKSIADVERVVKLEESLIRLQFDIDNKSGDDGDIDNIGSLRDSFAQIPQSRIDELNAKFDNGGDMPDEIDK